MISYKRVPVCLLLFTLVSAILFRSVAATTSQLSVPAGEEVTKPLSLLVDDHVFISFTVVGQTENTIDFALVDPHGNMTEFGRIGNVRYSFVCEDAGEYTLNFSNTFSTEGKFITLDYEIDHYILGMPQMLFLTVIIVVVCLAMVAVFVLMGKSH
jgi:hypothetical protein